MAVSQTSYQPASPFEVRKSRNVEAGNIRRKRGESNQVQRMARGRESAWTQLWVMEAARDQK